MSLRGWAPGKEILEPRGMWSAFSHKREGNPERASYMPERPFRPWRRPHPPGHRSSCRIERDRRAPLPKGSASAISAPGGSSFIARLAAPVRRTQSGNLNCPAPFDYTKPDSRELPEPSLFSRTCSPAHRTTSPSRTSTTSRTSPLPTGPGSARALSHLGRQQRGRCCL
jgi:hypothetical protein